MDYLGEGQHGYYAGRGDEQGRRLRGLRIGAGAGVADAGLVQPVDRVEEGGRPEVDRVVVSKADHIDSCGHQSVHESGTAEEGVLLVGSGCPGRREGIPGSRRRGVPSREEVGLWRRPPRPRSCRCRLPTCRSASTSPLAATTSAGVGASVVVVVELVVVEGVVVEVVVVEVVVVERYPRRPGRRYRRTEGEGLAVDGDAVAPACALTEESTAPPRRK